MTLVSFKRVMAALVLKCSHSGAAERDAGQERGTASAREISRCSGVTAGYTDRCGRTDVVCWTASKARHDKATTEAATHRYRASIAIAMTEVSLRDSF